MRKQKDMMWKGILEQLFEDFLTFIHPELGDSLDLAKGYEFLNKELIQEFPSSGGKIEQKIVDKLVKLHNKAGHQILLHLEVQEKYSKDFSKRMYAYFNRLYDKYKMSIVAYAILTEANEIRRAGIFGIKYMGTKLSYQYNTFKLALQDDDYIINHANPFALVVLIAKAPLLKKGSKNRLEFDQRLLAYKLRIVKLIAERRLSPYKERAIMNFLFYYTDFEFSETKAKFDLEVNLLTNKNTRNMITFEEILMEEAEMTGFSKGERKGIKKGKLEAKENEVYRLITKLNFSNDQIADYMDISLSFVKKVRAKLKAETVIQ
ncbi:hypothetical protein [Pedobacter sp. L105]|uniref:hypothetical protein n=1 Tax=Pedobacter sp. L105 TaxID=1641871 RepID=UPI00131CCE15|nr:hypothetical protein [Pedobacter sp. L105]